MNRPYIICHMVTSIDGKVTGGFYPDLSRYEPVRCGTGIKTDHIA